MMTLEETRQADCELLKALHEEINAIADMVQESWQWFDGHVDEWKPIEGMDREKMRDLADKIRDRSPITIGKVEKRSARWDE